jgi:hypothetical protein
MKVNTKGKFGFYYRIECYAGYRDNQTYEGMSFSDLAYNYLGTRKRESIKKLVDAYDSGHTESYFHIHLVMCYPDGSQKIINTARGL